MSKQIIYEKKIIANTSPISGNGNINFDQSIIFRNNTHKFLKLISLTIPSYIANICSNYDNDKLKITMTHATDTDYDFTVQFQMGSYDHQSLTAAINYSIQAQTSLITNISDPPIKISPNTTLDKMYITIDSTKLLTLGYTIDLDLCVNNFYKVLGFSATQVISGDGIFAADNVSRINYYGSNCNVLLNNVGQISSINGKPNNTLTSFSLENASGNAYIYPTSGIALPAIEINAGPYIDAIGVELHGDKGDDGNYIPIYFYDGVILMVLQLIETTSPYIV